MKRRILLLFSFIVCSLLAISQNQTVRGKVSSEDGRPLDGATINIKGTKIAVVANSEGVFSMNIPSSAQVLVISSVGFITTEQNISSDMNIVLKKDDRRLSEVVVVGYGQSQKRNVSGSISRIAARDIENQPVQSFESALQGKAPGVVIENRSAIVGQGIKVRIRGTSSLSASSQPLYVLDGIPLTTARVHRLSAGAGAGVRNDPPRRDPAALRHRPSYDRRRARRGAGSPAAAGLSSRRGHRQRRTGGQPG